MRTKLVEIHCPTAGCRLIVTNAQMIDLPNTPTTLFEHEFPSGLEEPFTGPRCEGSGRKIEPVWIDEPGREDRDDEDEDGDEVEVEGDPPYPRG